jgi:outer membrane protein TolC
LPTPKKRPEYQLFEYQKKSLQAMEKVVSTQNKPRVMAFAQLGYGRPGLNFLSNDFEAYYQFGVKLNWRIWDWGSRGRSLEQLKIKQALVQNQQEVFETNQQVKSERFDYQVGKLQELLKRDEEIIQLRRQIVQSAKAQMKNGVITTTQYLTLLNQSTQAEIRKQMHEIELLKTKVDDATLLGKR